MFLTDYKEMQNFIFKNRKKEDFQNMFEIKLLQLGFYVSVALVDSKGRIKDPTFMRNIGWTLDGEKEAVCYLFYKNQVVLPIKLTETCHGLREYLVTGQTFKLELELFGYQNNFFKTKGINYVNNN